METKKLKFAEAIEYCKKTSCSLFALNDKKFEIFIIELDDEHSIRISYDADDNICGDAGDEYCDCGVDENYDVTEAIREHSYIVDLIFSPFDKNLYDGPGVNNYFYSSQKLLRLGESADNFPRL